MDSFPANVNALKMGVTTPHHIGVLANPESSGGSRRGYRRARGRGGQKNEKQRERPVKNVSISNGSSNNKVEFGLRRPQKLLIDNTNKSSADQFDSRKDLKHTASSAHSDALRQNMQVTTDTVVQESKGAFNFLSVTKSQHCTPVSLHTTSNALWHYQ